MKELFPEYISIEEALSVSSQKVSLETMKWRISEGHLNAYLPLPPVQKRFPSLVKIPIEDMSDWMQLAGKRHWLNDETLYASEYFILDKSGNEVDRIKGGVDAAFKEIRIKRSDVVEEEPVQGRTNSMKAEIADIIRQGVVPNTASVWCELKRRCGKKDSCCIALGEDDKGQFIKWSNGSGGFKELRQKALGERLRTRKTG